MHSFGYTKYGNGRPIDMSHLLSVEQIDIVREEMTKIGDEVSFLKDNTHIEGTVSGTYKNLFTLKDGRSFTWVEYITGSSPLLYYLRTFHPIKTIHFHNSFNVYRMRTSRSHL